MSKPFATETKPFEAWHFLPADGRLRFAGRTKVEPGQTLTVEGPLLLCRHGLHWSRQALDALQYAPGPVVERVRVSGQIREGPDNGCSTERTCLWLADAATVLHEFVLWAAEQRLLAARAAGREPHVCSWAVLDAKRAWLRGELSDQELDNARDAARTAVWDALSYEAQCAARVAVWAAERTTIWADAWSSAWTDTWPAHNEELERRLFTLAPTEDFKEFPA